MPPRAVNRTPEFARVVNLPRRVPRLADAEAMADVLTREYALRRGVRLLPWQAFALYELLACDGLVWFAPVGSGKTLFTYLAATALGAERPLVVVPGSLKQKTLADFAEFHGVWRAPPAPIRVVSYHDLQRQPDLVERHAPDLLALDEADDLANPKSSMTLRLDRYVREHGYHHGGEKRPGSCRVAPVTGTPSRHSIMGYWHLLMWALGDGAPMPAKKGEAQTWDMILGTKPRMRMPSPGALGASVAQAREWFRVRLLETPGVVINDGDSCDAPLTLRQRLPRECDEIDACFDHFQHTRENPAGIPMTDGLSRWRLSAQLGCGLYTYWDPPPPQRWRDARRAFASFARDAIDASQRSFNPIETEGQVIRRYAEHPVVAEWLEQKPTYDERKHTKTAWFSDATIKSALDWLRELDEPGIVWSGSADFGPELARAARLRYFAEGGNSADGVNLRFAPEGQSFVASWNANKKGFNLQAWPRQLLVYPPQSAKWLEQVFGRSHRRGQLDHVVIDVLMTSGGTFDAFEAALEEAQGIRARESLTQKILRARIERVEPRLTSRNQYRWAARSAAA